MSTVKPIKKYEVVEDIADYLKEKNERDYVLFMTGIFTGRRISDILPLKIRDIKEKDRIVFIEGKTGKTADIIVHPKLKKIFSYYCKGKSNYEFVFKNNRIKNPQPISRVRVWQILNDAAEKFNYNDPIGCHTLRKTFAYWLYLQDKDVMAVKEILNQSDISVTKRYIGIDQELKDNKIYNLSFSKNR